jgi:hypothetical protein
LLRRFGADVGYAERLSARAEEMSLQRPLYHGLSLASGLLGTPVDEALMRRLQRQAPPLPVRRVLHAAMRRALLPQEGERVSPGKVVAEQFLFLRAHWLRMPPGMLLRHLWTQYRRRGGLKTAEQAAMPGDGHG